MKTLIVGTGIIGVIYGWALSQAGIDVTHYVRLGRATKFNDGLTLDVLDERKDHKKYNISKYELKCTEKILPTDNYDLVIVPVNIHQAEEVIKTLAPGAGSAIFLTLTGNWDGPQFILNHVPVDRCLIGYADGGGTIKENDIYWTNLGAELHIGLLDESAKNSLERIIDLFAHADIKLDVQQNMIHWLWQHAAGAVGFAAGFAKYRNLNLYLSDKELLRICSLSTKEMYKLCALRGVDLKQFPEASFINFPIWLIVILVGWNIRHQESAQRYTAHVVSEGSRQETKEFLKKMFKTAQELDFDMPYTKRIAAYLE